MSVILECDFCPTQERVKKNTPSKEVKHYHLIRAGDRKEIVWSGYLCKKCLSETLLNKMEIEHEAEETS